MCLHRIQKDKRHEEWEGSGEKCDRMTEEKENTGDGETTWRPAEDRKRRAWAEREGELKHADSDPTSATDRETIQYERAMGSQTSKNSRRSGVFDLSWRSHDGLEVARSDHKTPRAIYVRMS